MPAAARFGNNLLTDGVTSVSYTQGPYTWRGWTPARINDGVVTGSVTAVRYGYTYTFGAVANNNRGVTFTFAETVALKAMKFYSYRGVMDALVQYWNGAAWVDVATVILTVANSDAEYGDNGVIGEFNSDGAITATKWRWLTANYNTYATGNNFYAWEVECYSQTLAAKVLSGTITENLAVTNWLVRAYLLTTGELKFSADSSDGTFSFDVADENAYQITVTPDQGGKWAASTAHIVNDLAFPTDPAATPYYYKATVAGTTAATEPTWPTVPGNTVTDGGVTWECVERLVQAISHSPLIPQAAP